MIFVNGEARDDIDGGVTVSALLAALDLAQRDRGVAVAVDAEVVPRSSWEDHTISEGARVEVLVAVQGG